ncbi:aldolase [Microbacterium sp.]|uniref:aldolase n=1 Tax=Microbacterium sp. TaxID=51671 RepID=UPI002C98DAE6|nr:aldolase [Microbacterium sp.]HWK76862.1 aldolase [Microbacterium sp.]
MNAPASTAQDDVRKRIQSPSGGYAMLALDQRESLRAMFPLRADGTWATDEDLRTFKAEAVRELTPFASAVLLDREYALGGGRPAALAEGCGLIVAADVLHQVTGQPVSHSSIDEEVTLEFLTSVGADAVKFLVMWNERDSAAERVELIQPIVELCRRAGVASLIEAVVQTPAGKPFADDAARNDAILAAAAEIAPLDADVYKAQVPGYSAGDLSKVEENARALSEIVGTDWVVLSNGVQKEDFADAVTAALRGGASGFLAGRAIWADVVGRVDTVGALRSVSTPRLQNLRQIVEDGVSVDS